MPLVVVGVQQGLVGPALSDQRELPGEVGRVPHAGVHPLGAGRAVDVGGVARQDDPADAVAGDLRVVDLEVGHPTRVAHLDLTAHSGVGPGLDLFEGGVARVGGVDLDHHPGAGAREREQHSHAVGVGEHPDGVRGERRVDVDVRHGEVLAVEAALQPRARRVRVVLWPPSAPTTHPTRVVCSPSRERRVTWTPWASCVSRGQRRRRARRRSPAPRRARPARPRCRAARRPTRRGAGWALHRFPAGPVPCPCPADDLEGGDPPAEGLQPGQHTERRQHLQAAGVHAHGPGFRGRAFEGVDDAYRHAESGQLKRGRQADRSGPDDQHVAHGHHASTIPTVKPELLDLGGVGHQNGRMVTKASVHAVLDKIDGFVGAEMDHFGTSGVAVSVVYDDVVLFSKGYGVREVDKTDPITPDTVFSLASMSKPISGTAVAHLVAKGVIAWDEPVHDHVPGLRFSDPWLTTSTSPSRTSTRTAAACPGGSATLSSTSATPATRSWPASRWSRSSREGRGGGGGGGGRREGGGGRRGGDRGVRRHPQLYGLGWNVETDHLGFLRWSHSGAFLSGAATTTVLLRRSASGSSC